MLDSGGKVIREITEKTGAKVDITDDGMVSVAAVDGEAGKAAVDWIKSIVAEPETGHIYEGTVVKIMDFGAFVNFMPNHDGLVHVSEMADHHVEKVGVFPGERVTEFILFAFRKGRFFLHIASNIRPAALDKILCQLCP